jgi:hypothetical protein
VRSSLTLAASPGGAINRDFDFQERHGSYADELETRKAVVTSTHVENVLDEGYTWVIALKTVRELLAQNRKDGELKRILELRALQERIRHYAGEVFCLHIGQSLGWPGERPPRRDRRQAPATILAASDYRLLVPSAHEATEGGIPLVCVDSFIESDDADVRIGMGYLAVKAVRELIDGKHPPRYINTGSVDVTRDNMFQPENQKLLFPVAGGP